MRCKYKYAYKFAIQNQEREYEGGGGGGPVGGGGGGGSRVGALWDGVPRVCGDGGGCAGGVVPLGAAPVLSWCGEVSLAGNHHHQHASMGYEQGNDFVFTVPLSPIP